MSIARSLMWGGALSLILFQGCSSQPSQPKVAKESLTPAPAAPAPAAQSAPQAVVREIVNVKGDLYRVRSNNHYATFLVTGEGVILADPLNKPAAAWLSEELQKRFKQPVRYVLYSHHHFDHASGAGVFNEMADLVGRNNFAGNLKKSASSTAPMFANVDKNRDGRVTLEELPPFFASFLMASDANGDGALVESEIYASVIPPETTFADRYVVKLGGRTVEMISLVPHHSNDLAAIHYPAERALMVVDFVVPKSVPLGFDGLSPDNFLEAARQIEALDFDILLPGHGERIGTKADIVQYRKYVEELVAGVRKGIEAEQTVERIQASQLLTRYRDWANYEPRRNNNIGEVFRKLKADGA